MEVVTQNIKSKYCQKSGMLDSSAIPPGQGGFPAASKRFIMTANQHFLRYARLALGLWMLVGTQGLAGFSSIFVFGDGVSNTNNVPTQGGPAEYHENRYCNGRVFVEVLSDWLGVTFDTTKNESDFGNDSSVLIAKVNELDLSALTEQQKADALFIVWANNADFVNFTGDLATPWTDVTPWNTLTSTSIANHVTAITSLYDKGARKILMPNAVDVLRTPFYNAFRVANSVDYELARLRIGGNNGYNEQFRTAMKALMASKPGLQILLPDTFAFFDQVLANSEAFGMVNFNDSNAGGIDSGDPALNGAGAQYVFWDDYHPTAKFQMHLAAFFQQIISPVKVTSISISGGNVHLQLANMPLGRAGVVLGSPDLQAPWTEDAVIGTANPVIFATSGSKRFYRAAFPVVWVWP
jgi:phospholipase/lecithinase/hemolysin